MSASPRIRVTQIVSFTTMRAVYFEWLAEKINPDKFELSFILFSKGDSILERYLKSKQIPVIRIHYEGKKDVPLATLKCAAALRTLKTDVVHCHLFEASLLGTVAAALAGVPQRIVSRHYSDFHHVYHPKAVRYDRLINRFATRIHAISRNVMQILIEREAVLPVVSPSTTATISFAQVPESETKFFRELLNISGPGPVIGAISRFEEWKGLQYLIPAFKSLLSTHPNAVCVLANAYGPHDAELRKLLVEIPDANLRLLQPIDRPIGGLYGVMDIFVHVPVTESAEAFGATIVEALAAGVPSVLTRSGVSREFSEDAQVALLCLINADAIHQALLRILRNQNSEKLSPKMVRCRHRPIWHRSNDCGFEDLYALRLPI